MKIYFSKDENEITSFLMRFGTTFESNVPVNLNHLLVSFFYRLSGLRYKSRFFKTQVERRFQMKQPSKFVHHPKRCTLQTNKNNMQNL